MSERRESNAGARTSETRKPVLGWAKICYGMDLRGDRVTIVRAARSGSRVICRPVDEESAMRAELAAGDAASVGCLSPRESLTRWLEAPFPSLRKSVRVLPTLLDIKLPFAIEDCVYAFLDSHRQHESATRALAVVATKDAVEKKLELLNAAAGVDPLGLDQEVLAAWTQMLREYPDANMPSDRLKAVLIMEGENSSLVIGKGTEFINGYAVRIDDVPRIVRLVRAQCGSAGSDVQWFLAGSGALDAGRVEAVGNMLSREQLGTSTVVDEPESFAARGSAVRAMTAGPLRSNLRVGRFVHPDIMLRERKYRTRAVAILLAAGILLCGANLGVRLYAERMKARAGQSVAALVDHVAGFHVTAKGEDAMGIVAGRVEERKQELAPFIHAFERSIADLIPDIARTAELNDLKCEMLSISRSSIEISGVASEWNTIESLAAVAMRAGYDVEIERKESLADESVPFTIFSKGGR